MSIRSEARSADSTSHQGALALKCFQSEHCVKKWHQTYSRKRRTSLKRLSQTKRTKFSPEMRKVEWLHGPPSWTGAAWAGLHFAWRSSLSTKYANARCSNIYHTYPQINTNHVSLDMAGASEWVREDTLFVWMEGRVFVLGTQPPLCTTNRLFRPIAFPT